MLVCVLDTFTLVTSVVFAYMLFLGQMLFKTVGWQKYIVQN